MAGLEAAIHPDTHNYYLFSRNESRATRGAPPRWTDIMPRFAALA